MAQRMACIVLLDVHLAMGKPTVTALTQTVTACASDALPPMQLEKTVKDMLDHGSRYKNMELALGPGICLVLGCQLSESQCVYLPIKHSCLLTFEAGRSC